MNVNVLCWRRMIFVVPGFLLILGGCTVSEHVDINAPVADVWEYVSNSYNTREWSVYFHHISPLPGMFGVRNCIGSSLDPRTIIVEIS